MSLHVDFIKNEQSGQSIIARATDEGGHLIVKSFAADRDLATPIEAMLPPETPLERLATLVCGDLVYATEPHDEKDCRFTTTSFISFAGPPESRSTSFFDDFEGEISAQDQAARRQQLA